MSDRSSEEARLLSAPEREAVGQTRHPAIAGLSIEELQTLAKRLREARDRARDIARQQRREMRGKADARGATPARDNTGTVGKAEVLELALRRIGAQLRRGRTGGDAAAKPAKRAAAAPSKFGPPSSPGGAKASAPKPKRGSGPKLRTDPREIGRVSQAGKAAQARRDSKKG